MVKEGGQGVEGGERDLNKQNPEGWRQNHMQLGDGGEQQFQVQVQPQQQPPPKQCPRCGSNNTKFCYYNNHKLTQPRYLCKSCRRHWTQGGILRNIPVGSRSRKGKRAKNSSSSRSQQQPLQPPSPSQWMDVQTHHPNLTPVVKSKYPFGLETPFTYPLYQGDSGYLSSMLADPSLNPSQSHPFDQSRKIEDDVFGCSSNLGHTSGSKVGSLSSIHQIRPLQFYQMGGEQREVQPMYASQQGLIVPSSMSNTNSDVASHNDRPHNNVTYNSPLWSTINNNTTFISGSERNANVFGSTPLIPNQWPDFSGFGPPPSSD